MQNVNNELAVLRSWAERVPESGYEAYAMRAFKTLDNVLTAGNGRPDDWVQPKQLYGLTGDELRAEVAREVERVVAELNARPTWNPPTASREDVSDVDQVPPALLGGPDGGAR